MYRENYDGIGVVRTADNAYIPDNNLNADWVEYQEWLAAGNTPEPRERIVPKHPTGPATMEENAVALMYAKGIITLAEVIDL